LKDWLLRRDWGIGRDQNDRDTFLSECRHNYDDNLKIHFRPSRKSASYFLAAVIPGNIVLNPWGTPGYLDAMNQFLLPPKCLDIHVQLSRDSFLAQESLVKQALVAQRIQAADLQVCGRETRVVG
jgi:hypothetical protein